MLDIVEIIKKRGALKKGSFILTSGKISDTYIQLFKLLDHPEDMDFIAEKLAEYLNTQKCDVILAPAMGAIIIGYLTSKFLRTKYNKQHRFVFCERVNGVFILKRDFKIEPNDNVWILENIVTTGKSAEEAIDLAKKFNSNILGVISVVERGTGGDKLRANGYKYFSLAKIIAKDYDPSEAPKDLLDMKPIKPGGRV